MNFIKTYGFTTGVINHLTNNANYSNQYRNVYQILWLRKGKVKILLGNVSTTLEINNCLFLAQNELFKLTSEESFELHYIQFTEDFYSISDEDRYFLQKGMLFKNNDDLNVVTIENTFLEHFYMYIIHLKQINRKVYTELNVLIAHNTIKRILLFGSSLNKNKMQVKTEHLLSIYEEQILKNFNQLVKKNIATERSILFYLNVLGVDFSELKRICITVYGITPKKYLNLACANEAKILLKNTSYSIKEISIKLNFIDSSSFVRFFQKNVGITPSNYRDSINISRKSLL